MLPIDESQTRIAELLVESMYDGVKARYLDRIAGAHEMREAHAEQMSDRHHREIADRVDREWVKSQAEVAADGVIEQGVLIAELTRRLGEQEGVSTELAAALEAGRQAAALQAELTTRQIAEAYQQGRAEGSAEVAGVREQLAAAEGGLETALEQIGHLGDRLAAFEQRGRRPEPARRARSGSSYISRQARQRSGIRGSGAQHAPGAPPRGTT